MSRWKLVASSQNCLIRSFTALPKQLYLVGVRGGWGVHELGQRLLAIQSYSVVLGGSVCFSADFLIPIIIIDFKP